MAKQLRFTLGEAKTDKYKQYNRCVCYNLSYSTGAGNLYIVFLPDEMNGLTLVNTNCSIKNCKKILFKYFNKVKLIKKALNE